jgi:hypothetical protein
MFALCFNATKIAEDDWIKMYVLIFDKPFLYFVDDFV